MKVQFFFNVPVTYFVKCFRAKCPATLASGSPEICVFSKLLFRIQSQSLTYYAIVAFNWDFSVTTKNLRIVGFFVSIPFRIPFRGRRAWPSGRALNL